MATSQHSGDRTATGAGSAVDFGGGVSTYGNWVMVPTNFVSDSQIALEISPDNTTWTRVGVSVGGKPVVIQGAGVAARYARVNVVALGTNPSGAKVGAVLSAS